MINNFLKLCAYSMLNLALPNYEKIYHLFRVPSKISDNGSRIYDVATK